MIFCELRYIKTVFVSNTQNMSKITMLCNHVIEQHCLVFISKGVIKTNKIYLRPSLQISSFYIQRNLTRKYHTTVQPPGVTGNKYKTVYNFNYIIIFSKPCTQKSSMNQQRKPTTSFTLYLTTIFRLHSFAQYQSIQNCEATRNAHIICTSITSLQQSIMCCGGK